jgi:hypothetical protein
MNSREERDAALRLRPQGSLESPFLEEELFVEENGSEWQARLAALERESPFGQAFDQGQTTLIQPEELEEDGEPETEPEELSAAVEADSLEAEGPPQEQQTSAAGSVQTITHDAGQQWVTKVDQRMRSRFGLSGPGLADRVGFVTNKEFARRFPETQIREVLVNAFMMPLGDRQGTIVSSILRHHNRYDLLEGLRDQRLLQSRLEELERFVDGRVRAGGFTYDIAFGPLTIDPHHLVAELLDGFTRMDSNRANRRVLIKLPAAAEVLVHEACHFYEHPMFSTLAAAARLRFFAGMRLSETLREGFAEFFTRELMEANIGDLGILDQRAYQGYLQAVQRFIGTTGESLARSAFFGGESAAITKLRRAIELNIKHYPLLVPGFMIEGETLTESMGGRLEAEELNKLVDEVDEEESDEELVKEEKASQDFVTGKRKELERGEFGSALDEAEAKEEEEGALAENTANELEEPKTEGFDELDAQLDERLAAEMQEEILTESAVKKAVRLNNSYMDKLGWKVHWDRVVSFLGLTPHQFNERDLAQAVAAWQRSQGLTSEAVDGIIGPNTWIRMLAAIRATGAATPSEPSHPPHLPTFRLKYEGQPDQERVITKEDKEFRENYVDRNIVDSEATVQIDAGKILRWEVRYKDGRTKLFDVNTIPVTLDPVTRGRKRQMGVSTTDYYLKAKDGFIYPVFDQRILFDNTLTPQLVYMRSILAVKAQALKDLRQLMETTATFAPLIGALAQGISGNITIVQRVSDPMDLNLLK